MIRVLVAEDSTTVREFLVAVLDDDPEIEVVGAAENGVEAVRLTVELLPDVITMDIQMPVMDGLMAIEQIMAQYPTPILVLTGDPRGYSGELSMEALSSGALDLMVKPRSWSVAPADRDAAVPLCPYRPSPANRYCDSPPGPTDMRCAFRRASTRDAGYCPRR